MTTVLSARSKCGFSGNICNRVHGHEDISAECYRALANECEDLLPYGEVPFGRGVVDDSTGCG